jgi:hypothetical protein
MADVPLQESLRFRPKIWWDPVPDWLFTHLDREIVVELARVSVQVQREMLEVQLKSMDQISEVLAKVGR